MSVVADDPEVEAVPELPDSAQPVSKNGRLSRWWLLGAFVLALTAFIPDAFGREVFDTKIDLVATPVALLTNLVHLWDPRPWFGTVRNQFVGYAFPAAPLFALAHTLAIPGWLTQRIWMAGAETLAFWGAVRLAEALNIGTKPWRLLAGLMFALWPTFTILIAPNTGSILPEMLIPWVTVPLVRGSRTGSPVRAAALSAGVVVCMGGINAANTFDALIVPAVYLLTRERSARRSSLIRWWLLCTALAVSWWAIPLVFQGGYGFNFLPYVEQSVTTTSTMSITSALFGTGDWTAYVKLGGVWDQAGLTMVTLPVTLLAAGFAAATGLFGLARRDLPERRFFVWCFGIGILATTSGYWGQLGGPLSFVVRPLLDGPLVPFRNVYKFQPILAIALVMGACHALSIGGERLGHIGSRLHAKRRRRFSARWLVAILAVLPVVGLATPYFLGRILPGDSFTAIPGYWYQVAAFLAKNSPHTTALVVPPETHGEYNWGWTIDNPLEAIATSPWADREVTPYGGPATERMLDSIEGAVKTGLPTPGMGALLSRSGIRYIVVQNDLNWQLSDDPSPAQVNAYMGLEGFKRVATFGPTVETRTGQDPILRILKSQSDVPYPAVEIFKAPTSTAPVEVYPVSDAALVSGGPESILQLLDSGVIGPRQAAVLAGNWKGKYSGPQWVVTDTLRRTETRFGVGNDNYGITYTATQAGVAPPRFPAQSEPYQMVPFPGTEHETVAVYSGAASVTASSYGSYIFALPEDNPANVFESDATQPWYAASPYGSDGQWVQVNFSHPVDPVGTTVAPAVSPGRPLISEIEVSTNRGSVTSKLTASGNPQPVAVPRGSAAWMRFTVKAVTHQVPGGANAGISHVTIPGVHIQEYLQPPEEPYGWDAKNVEFSFAATQVNPAAILREPPEPVLARQFSLRGSTTFAITGEVIPRKGPLLDDLIASLPPATGTSAPKASTTNGPPDSALHVSATSTLDGVPWFRPQNLFDDVPSTDWIADGPNATVTLSWPKPRKLDSLIVGFSAAGLPDARPKQILLSSSGEQRLINLPAHGPSVSVKFAPIVTDSLKVSFPEVQTNRIINGVGQLSDAPVGLSDLYFPALAAYTIRQRDPLERFTEACGSGPPVVVDGTSYPTAVSGVDGDLTDLTPLALSLCTPSSTLTLGPGVHKLITPTSASPFEVSALNLETPGLPAATPAARATTVTSWQAGSRTVKIGPGGASYLEMHQNYDRGWVATLNGKTLTPIVLDGWQQGFVVPAGAGGDIHLAFKPEGLYLAGLLAGALGVALLLLILAGFFGLRRRRQELAGAGPGYRLIPLWAKLVLATLLVFVAAGPVAVAVPILALVGLRWRYLVPWLAGVCMLAAGVVAAVDPGSAAETRIGAFSPVAQCLAAVAVAAVLVPIVARRRRPALEAEAFGDSSEPDIELPDPAPEGLSPNLADGLA